MTEKTLPIYFKRSIDLLRASLQNLNSLLRATVVHNTETELQVLRNYAIMTPNLTRAMVEVKDATSNLDNLERTPAPIGESRSTIIDAARGRANVALDQLAILLSNAIPSAKAKALILPT